MNAIELEICGEFPPERGTTEIFNGANIINILSSNLLINLFYRYVYDFSSEKYNIHL